MHTCRKEKARQEEQNAIAIRKQGGERLAVAALQRTVDRVDDLIDLDVTVEEACDRLLSPTATRPTKKKRKGGCVLSMTLLLIFPETDY